MLSFLASFETLVESQVYFGILSKSAIAKKVKELNSPKIYFPL